MSRVLLQLEDVSKSYPPTALAGQRLRSFWQLLVHGRSGGGKRVLEDIGFTIRAGESMGIVGANGAGKSTLLKIITGVLAPTSGVMEQHGTRAALLELGAGFEPEYSGLDNLHMNAAFLGLSRQDVAARLDDILAFADIGEAIHEPIKHYSSGMVVRLGFAVVASVRPDLLITDEVLAVGDESFQKKCIRWVERYLGDGGTLLMVSHNMYQVQKLCRSALWLDAGRAREQGDVFRVTQAYLAWHERLDARERQEGSRYREASSTYRVERLEIVEPAGEVPTMPFGECLKVRLVIRSPDGRAPVGLVGLVRADGTPVYGVGTDHDGEAMRDLGDGCFGITIAFPELSVLPGGYAVRASAMDPEGLRVHDTAEEEFAVTGRSRALGLVRLGHQWLDP